MLCTAPTYVFRTEARLTPSPCILHDCKSPKGVGSFVASEPLLYAIGGG